MPPMILFKGKNLYEKWTKNDYPGTKYAASEKGWMTTDAFLTWFRELFLQHLPSERPILLLLDGHISHVSYELVNEAIQNGVHLLKLPPHTTSHLQPLDKVCFGVVKNEWQKLLRQYVRHTRSRMLGKEKFTELLKNCWWNSMTPGNIIASFRATGVQPFDRSKIPVEITSAGDAFSGDFVTCDNGNVIATVATEEAASTSSRSKTTSNHNTSSISIRDHFIQELFSPEKEPSKEAEEQEQQQPKKKRYLLKKGELLTAQEVAERLKNTEGQKRANKKSRKKSPCIQ